MKSVFIRSFPSPYFPAFGLNTERYSVLLRIQSKCCKIWARKIPNTDTFHAVNWDVIHSDVFLLLKSIYIEFKCKSRSYFWIIYEFHIIKRNKRPINRYLGEKKARFTVLLNYTSMEYLVGMQQLLIHRNSFISGNRNFIIFIK